MTNSTSTSNPRKKRRITDDAAESSDRSPANQISRWRTESEKRIYSSNLATALCNLRRTNPAAVSGRAVRDAADRALAVSGKGKSRWSRAILTNRLSLRLSKINRRHKKAARPAVQKKSAVQKKLPPLQSKVKVLSRLVPGCRKVSLPSLLEETTDYIAALEMQVEAMRFLSGILNGGVLPSPATTPL